MATPIPSNEASFTLAEIAECTGGRVIGSPDERVTGVTSDSREAGPGTLFVALRGARHDGHAFASTAQGALLVEEQVGDAAQVVVEDTLEALGALAQAHRLRWGGRLVAITGSAGKTSTKEMTVAALRACGVAVRATLGNLNNRVGVPMTLLTLTDADEIAVVEMGTSEPGEIEALAGIALPDVGVVTIVGAAHTEGLGGLEGVLREKASLYSVLEEDDTAIINADDRRLNRVHVDARRLEFGEASDADVRLTSWSLDGMHTRASFALNGETFDVRMALLGGAAAKNAAAATAIVHALGFDVAKGLEGIAGMSPVAGRMSATLRADGLLVIDDTYNANPASMKVAVDTARALADSRGAKLLCVLGDMKELGGEAGRAHVDVLGHASSKGEVVAVGPLMREASTQGDFAKITFLDEASEVRLEVGEGDVVLVKGSRSMALERVVHALQGVAA